MTRFHFKLVESHLVSDYGAHDLSGAAEAQLEAIKLAESVRETRPELLRKHGLISVTDENGAGVCAIPLDIGQA